MALTIRSFSVLVVILLKAVGAQAQPQRGPAQVDALDAAPPVAVVTPDEGAVPPPADGEKDTGTSPKEDLPDPQAPSQKDDPAQADPIPAATEASRLRSLDEELKGVDQTGSPALPPRDLAAQPLRPLAAGERRATPNYDGRPEPQTDAGDVVRMVPRAAFFPLYLVLEYGLRQPTVWTITKVEETHLADKVTEFFTWDNGRAYAFPMVSFDYGVRPNAGLVFRWNEIAPRHDVAGTFFAGPGDLWAAALQVDQKLFRDEEALIRWRGGYVRRPDNVFFGISDLTSRCNYLNRGCRYRSAVAEGSLSLVGWEQHLNQVSFGATFRHARFSLEQTATPPLTQEEADALPGFDQGYQIVQPYLSFAVDTRSESLDFARGTGLRLEGNSAFAVDVLNTDSRWFRASGEGAAFYDLGFGQILGMSLYYEGLVNAGWSGGPDGRPPVPFYELPYLGGDQMKSFLRRRLVGHNAWAINFEYRYPITWGLDASLFSSIGNTFEDLSEWDLIKNYLNYGLALKLGQTRVSSFEAIVGWGSNRFDEPSFDPFNQFRFTIGINKGF